MFRIPLPASKQGYPERNELQYTNKHGNLIIM